MGEGAYPMGGRSFQTLDDTTEGLLFEHASVTDLLKLVCPLSVEPGDSMIYK